MLTAGLVAIGAGVAAGQAPAPPALLADVLRGHADWRILDPTTDLVGDYTIQQLEELDRWPPWMEQDLDGDGHDDVAAVIVRRGAAGQPEFTVAVVHAARPDRAELVVPFAPQRMFGVSEGIRDDSVMPLLCADCDANVWYRWNGRAYEPRLRTTGEALLISGEPGRRLMLFSDPRPDAARTADVPPCSRGRVLEVGGREGQRWYRVEVLAGPVPRGWIPAQFVMERVDCQP